MIQVRSDDAQMKLLGHLSVRPHAGARTVCISILDFMPTFLVGEDIMGDVRQEVFHLERMSVSIDNARLKMSGMSSGILKERYQIPDDADFSEDIARDRTVASWYAIKVSNERHEAIFDLKEFVPV